ncbi:MAG TPA: Ig-like domain-containing protein [Acetobacteraceae bacterium]|jgi:hypothetical protein|nr:Ig-like domain-containing protein [Acetobacteraceae bacterium]
MANSTTTLTSSLNPAVFGQAVTFTATVAVVPPDTGTPTGVVTFLDGGVSIGTGTLNVSGVTTLITSALTPGSHTITASYAGDGTFNPSIGSLTGNPQVVAKANTTTTLTSSLNPSTISQPVTFTATVAVVAPGVGVPSGVVTFLNQGNPAGNATLTAGVATLTLAALTPGSHTIVAEYDGDTRFNPSTVPLTGNPQVVSQLTPVTLKPLNTLSLVAATPQWLVGPLGNYTFQMLNLGTGPVLISESPSFNSSYTLPPQTPFALSLWGPTGIFVSAAAAESLSVALIPR